jgi:hypothetical protein
MENGFSSRSSDTSTFYHKHLNPDDPGTVLYGDGFIAFPGNPPILRARGEAFTDSEVDSFNNYLKEVWWPYIDKRDEYHAQCSHKYMESYNERAIKSNEYNNKLISEGIKLTIPNASNDKTVEQTISDDGYWYDGKSVKI